jgi:competence protein ComEC
MALAWAAAAWIAGSVAAAVFGASAWPLAVALAALVLTVALLRRETRAVWYAIALPALLLAALLRFELHDAGLAADDVAHFAGGPEIRMRAVLRDDPDIGDIVELEGRLEDPTTESGNDYANYLSQRGVHSMISFAEIRIIGHDNDNPLRAGLLHVRRRLSHALAVSLPEPQASLAQGVLLGKRSALPADLNDDLNATNTSHLVVVSGANVVLVSAFAASLLTWIFGRRRALWLSIAAVVGYMLLVGLSPPVVRGTIMGILLVMSQVTGRRTNGLVSILFAAAVMIGVSPYAVHDVSFQLSFAATAGLVFLSGPIHDWTIAGIARLFRREALPSAVSSLLVGPVAMTAAAIIATEPLIALNFERLSLVAIPANLLVVPVFGLILFTSTLAAIGGLIPHAHLVLGAPAYYLLTYWIEVAGRLAALPAASVTFDGYSSRWAFTSYVAITAAAFALLRRFGRPPAGTLGGAIQWRRFAPFAAGAVPAAVLVVTAGFVFGPETDARRLRVTVLDVGQGDAILIETPGGQDILVDGGPGSAVLRSLGDELSWRDRSIEMVVLTHPAGDHLYGLLDVFDRYDVQRVVANPIRADSGQAAAWIAAVTDEGLVVEAPAPGTVFDLGDGVRLEVIGPAAAVAADLEVNNTSLIVRLVWREVSFLLTGDMEMKAEQALLASGAVLTSTVLKVAHHGSLTSSADEFLAAVRPRVSAISAGKDNKFGHPRPEIVDRLDDYGPVYTTGEVGAIRFETDGQRLWVSTTK